MGPIIDRGGGCGTGIKRKLRGVAKNYVDGEFVRKRREKDINIYQGWVEFHTLLRAKRCGVSSFKKKENANPDL